MFMTDVSGGIEELKTLTQLSDSSSVLNKPIRKSPSFFKAVGYAAVPVGAVLGFLAPVPSRRLTVHTISALVTTIAATITKSKLDSLTEQNAKPAIAAAIVDNISGDGLSSMNDASVEDLAAAIQSIRDTHGILPEDFDILCTDVYATYLLGMVKHNPIAKTADMKELQQLRSALNLSNLQVGEAHLTAAQKLYRQISQQTSPEELMEDEDHPDFKAIDKFLFLTERMLRGSLNESETAFVFEMTRTAKALGGLKLATALERIAANVVEPFYQRALSSTRAKLDSNQVNSNMLERARSTLGIDVETAHDLHIATFNAEVRSLLLLPDAAADGEEGAKSSANQGEFQPGAMDRVSEPIAPSCHGHFLVLIHCRMLGS
jgi:hypothetical protein